MECAGCSSSSPPPPAQHDELAVGTNPIELEQHPEAGCVDAAEAGAEQQLAGASCTPSQQDPPTAGTVAGGPKQHPIAADVELEVEQQDPEPPT